MTRTEARELYASLRNEAEGLGLNRTAFDVKIKAQLAGKNGSATPEDYCAAAKSIVLQLRKDRQAEKASRPKAEKLLQLPPSILVTAEVSTPGDISYEKLSTEQDRQSVQDTDGERQITIEETTRTTKRTVRDVAEQQAAMLLASRMRASLRALGRVLHSGVLLVPKDKETELDTVIRESREQARGHNSQAKHHFLRVSVVKALITSDAETAARDAAWTIQEALQELTAAVNDCDADAIRATVAKAKSFGAILGDQDSKALEGAIEAARRAARYIVKKVKKSGELIATVRAELDTAPIEAARIQFLGYEVPAEMEAARDSLDAARIADLETTAPVEPQLTEDTAAQQRFAAL